jgi:hypothetical protein
MVASSSPTSKTMETRRIEVLSTPMEGPYSTNFTRRGKGGPAHLLYHRWARRGRGREPMMELSLGGSLTQGLSGLVQYQARSPHKEWLYSRLTCDCLKLYGRNRNQIEALLWFSIRSIKFNSTHYDSKDHVGI